LKVNTIFAGFAILTLLFGFSGITNFDLVYAEHTDSPDEHDVKRDEYKDERDAKKEEYKDERDAKKQEYKQERDAKKQEYKQERDAKKEEYKQERDAKKQEYKQERDAKKEEYKQERDAKREEYKDERDRMRDEYKADRKEAKIIFKTTRDEFKQKYVDLKNQLKDELRQLKADRHTASEMAAMSSEISEEEILDFEEKRKRLHDLKREFREQILDLKTQARMQTDEMKQKFIQANEERKNKLKAKLYVLKLKFKDRILDHPIIDYATDVASDEKRHVVICHVPPGNPENEHSIRVSINAVHAHLAHGDSLGPCDGEMSDDTQPPDREQKTIELTESIGISDTE